MVQLLGSYQDNLWLLYLMSVIVATVLEWIAGFLLEKLFHHKWWDYFHIPGNIQGYVCLPFSLVWRITCVAVIREVHPFVFRFIRWISLIFGKGILALLLIGMAADLCVTVNGILNLNLRLEKMQKTAEESQRLSVHLGKNVSKNVLNGMEKQEAVKQKAEKIKARYQGLMESTSSVNRRLIRAFPKMESRKYGRQLQDLKEYFQKRKTDKER